MHCYLQALVFAAIMGTILASHEKRLKIKEKIGPPPSPCINSWKADGYCDDNNNIDICDYDGGDCCGDNVNTSYCYECTCKTGDGEYCQFPNFVADGFCDDGNNKSVCDFDGGDCCGSNVITTYCTECLCLEP